VVLVEILNEVEGGALGLGGNAVRGGEVEDGVLAAAENSALIEGGQIACAVALRAALHCAVAHDDEGGEVLIFAAEAIDGPGAETGATGELRASGAEVHGWGVIEGVAIATADDGHVIDVASHVREERRDFDAGLTVVFELPGAAAHDGLGEVDAGGLETLHEGGGDGLAGEASEFGFGVPGIDMANAAVHEEVDDRFDFGGLVGRLGGERVVAGGL